MAAVLKIFLSTETFLAVVASIAAVWLLNYWPTKSRWVRYVLSPIASVIIYSIIANFLSVESYFIPIGPVVAFVIPLLILAASKKVQTSEGRLSWPRVTFSIILSLIILFVIVSIIGLWVANNFAP